MGKTLESCLDLTKGQGKNRGHKTVVEVQSKVQDLNITEKKKEAMSWGYSYSNGPHTWAVNFPDAAGHDQSPIDIHTNETIFDSELEATPLDINYGIEESFTACNTGSSFKVNISQTSELKGGPLTDVYKLEQFHLHWGSSDDHGSEHMIDGQKYAAELHLVHWNSTKYSSFADAASQSDGLAVLGIMIQSGAENEGFKDMVDTIRNVKKSGQTCQVLKSFNPSVLLPENTKEFWTYHGSLTTPPCYESVQWIVLRESVQYSPNQLQALRSLLNNETESDCIVDNYRPPMPIGGRKIRASFKGAS
ncbi:carbonic anhydrase 1-like isoform X2 [Mercenaria mercenaria]|uniref:carbonic anhydrase 1-like isoform X2 n=1 Tax=Mercenaria mercenaria TaxID=6596 RepID=UPI001E1E1685|nr:carbonic anhydrase 1-like isoform X2 [Mercenaria mercenaria]